MKAFSSISCHASCAGDGIGRTASGAWTSCLQAKNILSRTIAPNFDRKVLSTTFCSRSFLIVNFISNKLDNRNISETRLPVAHGRLEDRRWVDHPEQPQTSSMACRPSRTQVRLQRSIHHE